MYLLYDWVTIILSGSLWIFSQRSIQFYLKISFYITIALYFVWMIWICKVQHFPLNCSRREVKSRIKWKYSSRHFKVYLRTVTPATRWLPHHFPGKEDRDDEWQGADTSTCGLLGGKSQDVMSLRFSLNTLRVDINLFWGKILHENIPCFLDSILRHFSL